MKKTVRLFSVCLGAAFVFRVHADAVVQIPVLTNADPLHLPLVGQNELHILSSNVLEVKLITTKSLAAGVGQWDFVSALGLPMLPASAKFMVLVDGKPDLVSAVSFKRRPLYAPLASYDLRINNDLYLQLASPVASNQTVQVLNPDASLWSSRVISPARWRVRNPVPHATSSVAHGSSAWIAAVSAERSASHASVSRTAKRPGPRYHSS